jgi:hypothetical protein
LKNPIRPKRNERGRVRRVMQEGKRSMGKAGHFSLLPGLSPTWRGGILKKFLVFFGDFHQTDSHAKGVFLFVPANSFPPGLRRYPSPWGEG